MIQTIFLSTAIAFKFIDVAPGKSVLPIEINCTAFQEVQGWKWQDIECGKLWNDYWDQLEFINKHGYAIRVVSPSCELKPKILWRKLIGMCDDGTVRVKEIK